MNCNNCGATLELDPSNGMLQCHYCCSQQMASGDLRSLDDIITSESTTGIFCPCCMDERQLQHGMLEKTRIAFCSECFGFLVDSQSMGQLLRNRRKEYSGADDDPIPVDRDSLARVRNCPRCEQRMETHPYHGPGNAVLDSCNRCKMIWLDNGEFSQLIRASGVR